MESARHMPLMQKFLLWEYYGVFVTVKNWKKQEQLHYVENTEELYKMVMGKLVN
jgi:hypothetical protein